MELLLCNDIEIQRDVEIESNEHESSPSSTKRSQKVDALVLPAARRTRKGKLVSVSMKRERQRHEEREGSSHLDRLIPSSTDDFVGDPINTVDLVGVTREISLELVRLEIPDLR